MNLTLEAAATIEATFARLREQVAQLVEERDAAVAKAKRLERENLDLLDQLNEARDARMGVE